MGAAAVSSFGAFVWNAKDYIVSTTTCAIPLAIEAIVATARLCRNPYIVCEKITEMKQTFNQAFFRQPGEQSRTTCIKVVKNVSKVLVAGAAVGASVALPFVYLHSSMAIPAALAAIQLTGRALHFAHKTPGRIKKAKDYIKDTFTKRNDETDAEYKARKRDGVKHIVYYSLVFAATATMAGFGIKAALLIKDASSPWEIAEMLPSQTPAVVFLEYAALGALHAIVAARAGKHKNFASTAFHGACAASAIAFPTAYLIEDSDVRLHHSFIGLVVQLAPWRSTKFFGTVISLDSLFNLIDSRRGYIDGLGVFHQYDYQNALVEQLPFALSSLSALSLVEDALDYFMKPTQRATQTASLQMEEIPMLPHERKDLEEIDSPLLGNFGNRLTLQHESL